jgi:hypothetical protein
MLASQQGPGAEGAHRSSLQRWRRAAGGGEVQLMGRAVRVAGGEHPSVGGQLHTAAGRVLSLPLNFGQLPPVHLLPAASRRRGGEVGGKLGGGSVGSRGSHPAVL